MKRSEAIKKLNTCAAAIKELGAKSLYLFGSTARDEANSASDIDLFIDYDSRSRFNALDLAAAKRLLQACLGVRVDLTTRKGLHPLIRKQIEGRGDADFLDDSPLADAAHPRHAREYSRYRKNFRS